MSLDASGLAMTLHLWKSAAFHKRAASVLAGGACHDSWQLQPFAPAFVSAEGARKQDIDGNDVIDFWMGHGSLLLGHGHPDVIAAVEAQLRAGTHLGGLTVVATEWAEAVRRLLPSAEKVRFTASGSEAAQLALRVARAFTSRPCIIRLDGHYHGWHDPLLAGVHAGSGVHSGLPPHDASSVAVLHPLDLEGVEERLAMGDVAAIILEPGGGGSGVLDWSCEHLRQLRSLADRSGALLIFDEVISGFRYAPGGVQALAEVVPDLTVLAKILCGGLPGGAVVGRKGPMSVFGDGVERPFGRARITHAGTFNGFALSAAAGIATLRLISDGKVQLAAERAAERLCAGVNDRAAALGVDAALFRNSSTIHLLLGPGEADVTIGPSIEAFALIASQPGRYQSARRALLHEGIDMHATHGWVSSAHDDSVIDEAVTRFAAAFKRLGPPVETCVSVCHMPECACRRRVIAGCDLPLADPSRATL